MKKFILLIDIDGVRARQLKDELEQSDPENICVVWAKDTDEIELQLEGKVCFGVIVFNKLASTETVEALALLKQFRELYPESALMIADPDLRKIINLSCYVFDADSMTPKLILEKYPS